MDRIIYTITYDGINHEVYTPEDMKMLNDPIDPEIEKLLQELFKEN